MSLRHPASEGLPLGFICSGGTAPAGQCWPRAACAALPRRRHGPGCCCWMNSPCLLGLKARARSRKNEEQHQKQKVEGGQEERGQVPFPSFSFAPCGKSPSLWHIPVPDTATALLPRGHTTGTAPMVAQGPGEGRERGEAELGRGARGRSS